MLYIYRRTPLSLLFFASLFLSIHAITTFFHPPICLPSLKRYLPSHRSTFILHSLSAHHHCHRYYHRVTPLSNSIHSPYNFTPTPHSFTTFSNILYHDHRHTHTLSLHSHHFHFFSFPSSSHSKHSQPSPSTPHFPHPHQNLPHPQPRPPHITHTQSTSPTPTHHRLPR